jgi:hypothetical protein
MNKLCSSHGAGFPRYPYRVALLAAFLAVIVGMSAFSFTPAAHAASQSTSQAKQCVMVVDHLHPGQRTSRVLAYTCATGNQQLQIPNICIGQRTLLMSWYVDANYGGSSTLIYGCGGPCDSAGYGIAYVGDGWNDRISSYKVWNNCFYSRAYTNSNYGGTCQRYHNNVPWVGSTMNDKISSFWVNLDVHYC